MVKKAKKILDQSRIPLLPADVKHSYQDKYSMSNFVCKSAILAAENALGIIGLGPKVDIIPNQAVSLSFESVQKCELLEKKTRIEKSSKTQHVQSTAFGAFSSHTETKIDEWIWNCIVSYKLKIFYGADRNNSFLIQENNGNCKIKTLTEQNPKNSDSDCFEVDITWLLKTNNFSIVRDHKDCKTPRRNQDAEKCIKELNSLSVFAHNVSNCLLNKLFPIEIQFGENLQKTVNISIINTEFVFNPVFVFMEESDNVVPFQDDLEKFLARIIGLNCRSKLDVDRKGGKIFKSNSN